MTPTRHHNTLTSPIRERLPMAPLVPAAKLLPEPPRGYSGYIIPLSIGLGIGAGYGTYRVFGRFKENPSDVNSSKPTPTPTIKPNIMRNRRYQAKPN